MGVPSFFRWLLEKYPRVIKYVKEEFIEYDDNGDRILPDSSGKNPNGTEYDNLYLDMNGIIHPCCHPETGPQPKNETEMITNVFKYISHIFSMVRPRKLLYLAIDGVAPRAKMNQQRARRFRAAQERQELITTRKKLESYYHSKGWNVPSSSPPSWDHNVITPGTPFMDKLAQALRYWIAYKLHNDSGWKGIKVILSDANIPGEGEHKIAQFVRRCRGLKGYDPNTRHVLYGLDADLFMLGLATHEIHFTILREEVLFGKNAPCHNCGIPGHWADKCSNPPKSESTKITLKPFIFADLCVLREYLEYELRLEELEWWDLERVIDDFVFLCFFVGNDFLPHLPSLEIREGAIDNLLKFYKSFLPKFGGFLTENGGKVNLDRVGILLQKLGDIEDEVFKNRNHKDSQWKKRKENTKIQQRKERIYKQKQKTQNNSENINKNTSNNYYNDKYKGINDINLNEVKLDDEYDENQVEFLQFFNEYDIIPDDHFMEKDFEHQLKAIHRASQDVSKCKNITKEPDLLFGTHGFKQRYYFKKLHINYDENPPLLQQLIFEYVRGLCWVFNYYYKECVSWSWFYPFHYAPFASDLKRIENFEGDFNFAAIKSQPFTPYGQLMGVLPAVSGKVALPHDFSKLMYESSSPIIDFYPTDFKLDLNGKMYNWQAVVLLPFVDAVRLQKCIKPLELALDMEHQRMNGIGDSLLFVNKTHSLSRVITPLYEGKECDKIDKIDMDQQLSQGINGYLSVCDGGMLYGTKLTPPKAMMSCMEVIEDGVDVVSCVYELPQDHIHKCSLLDGGNVPEALLDATDFEHMERAPRFGKPRHFKRRDTHYNYNRGWDANIGYAGGKYKAKHDKNARFELNYQPTRREYDAMHSGGGHGGGHGRAKILDSFSAKMPVPQAQWVPKSKQVSGVSGNIHASTSNNAGPYKCVIHFPVFDPYPNQCDVWNHRPVNAPYSVDPCVDLTHIVLNINTNLKLYKNNKKNRNYNNNNNKYDNNARSYNSQRGNNNNNNNYQQQQQQGYGQYYNRYQQSQSQTPTHQQWYPQQTYQGNNNYQQQYYNNYYYQNAYQQQYYQAQQQQQQSYSQQYQAAQNNNYRVRNQQGNQNQSQSNQNSRKWG